MYKTLKYSVLYIVKTPLNIEFYVQICNTNALAPLYSFFFGINFMYQISK